ncbi:MAG: ATP-binding protein [Candidatus Methanoplasma sp.]|jgi:predicted AAA+ superfamily ATPase|nr:ATP-binding protein [Candidatus Methanoplasma sp.]
MKDVLRTKYLDFLSEFKDDTDVIKVICGVRRCGKSTLMHQFIERLKASGVDAKNIIFMNMESAEFDDIKDQADLKKYFKERIGKERTYVMLDEIQRVEKWEVAINSLAVDFDADIYITGSNAYLLSSELSTYLTGRYVSINMLPLSFAEYTELHSDRGADKYELFELYLKYGAFPMIDPFESEMKVKVRIVDLYRSIVYRDIAFRDEIKNIAELERVTKFMMFNIGNPISANKIANSLGGIHRNTVENYLKLLEESYILYRADRYDIKSTALSPSSKYYSVDTGIRNAPLNYKNEDYGRLLENLVYLELVRRGDPVYVGKYGDSEVDFTVRTSDGYAYYQVTRSMNDDHTSDRELRPLKAIRDNYPKTVISTDVLKADFEGGIKHIHIIDFLMGKG